MKTNSAISVRHALAAVATAAIGLTIAAPASAQTSVNISIGQPGFYGALNVGGYPPPALYYPQPVIIGRPIMGPPIYLRVPEGHRRHWARFCGRYGACGRQVYFVQDNWYYNTYAPRYREIHYRDRPVGVRENFYGDGGRDRHVEQRREERHDEHRDHGRGHEGDNGRGAGGDRGRGHDGDHGNGNGNGHGRHGD